MSLSTLLKNKTHHQISFLVPRGLDPIRCLPPNKKTLVKLSRILHYNGWVCRTDKWAIGVLIDGYPVKGLEITSSILNDYTRLVFKDDRESLYIDGTPENDSDILLRLKLCPAFIQNLFWNKRPNNQIAKAKKSRNGNLLSERDHSQTRACDHDVLPESADLQMRALNCQPNVNTAVRLDEPVRRTNKARTQLTGVGVTKPIGRDQHLNSKNNNLDSRSQWPRSHPPASAVPDTVRSGSKNERAHSKTRAHNNDILLEMADLQMRALNSQPDVTTVFQLDETVYRSNEAEPIGRVKELMKLRFGNQLDSFDLFVIAFIIVFLFHHLMKLRFGS